VTRFEDTFREREVYAPDPRSITKFTPFMEGITSEERDAIADALTALRAYAERQDAEPGKLGWAATRALARLDAGVSE
jgi:hypothetical protein